MGSLCLERLKAKVFMKTLKILASVGGIAAIGLGVAMAIANPSREAYNEYATSKLVDFVKDQGCSKVPVGKDQCLSVVDSARPQLMEGISQNTHRQNFILFSIYKTEISIPVPLTPSYRFETLGAFQSFYTFKQEQN